MSVEISADAFHADPAAAMRLADRASCVVVRGNDGATQVVIFAQRRDLGEKKPRVCRRGR